MARITIAGTGEALVGTHDHPIFSEDRGSYTPLGDLVPGERIRTADGWAMVESLARWWGQQEVHNLEVDVAHRFYVGHAGVESHNANPCGGASPAPKGTAAAERAQNIEKGIPESQLGPSGKPKIHVVKHSTQKQAKDAARAEVGKGGTTAKHPSPQEGGPHFHGQTQQGTKSRVHHEYPE